MKQSDIERRVLQLWTSTNVPMTLANVQAYTGATRVEVQKALDAMASAQVVELDSDDAGNLLYVVGGSARMPRGATTIGEVMKLEQLRGEVGMTRSSGASLTTTGGGEGKSVVASGLLSFFLGPFGLLYAAPVVEAVVPIAVFMGLSALLPQALLSPIMALALPICGIAGVVYAVRHNKTGRRTSLLPENSQKRLR